MRALASRARFGWRLSDLARHCDIDKGTARRILNCLVRERLAERSSSDQRYLPGPMLFELGLALPDYDEFKMTAYPVLEQLAQATGAVAFLCLRSGDDVVCAARVGNTPDHAFTLNLGTRRPMVGSGAGAAVLVSLTEEERVPIIERNHLALAQTGSNLRNLERLMVESLAANMGYNEGCFVPGWNSYALPVRNATGSFAALMISAPAAVFTPAHRNQSIAALRTAAAQMQALADSIFGRQRRPEGDTGSLLALAALHASLAAARTSPAQLRSGLQTRRDNRQETPLQA